MSFFKNDKKKEEVKADITPVEKIEVPVIVKTEAALVNVDNKNDEREALIVEAIELFSKMLKGYPVSDKVKVWVELANKRL